VRVDNGGEKGKGKDHKIYSFVRSQYVLHWNPSKIIEYSYRMLVLQKNGARAEHLTHGLFKNGVFCSGQCIKQEGLDRATPVVWEGLNQLQQGQAGDKYALAGFLQQKKNYVNQEVDQTE